MDEKKINVLLVEPGKHPESIKIKKDLKSLQKAVGGMIEVVYPFSEQVGIICNEEGKINGMELNRALKDEQGGIRDIIAGPFVVTGLTEDSFCSLTKDQLKQYEKKFHCPETFLKMGRTILAIPVPDDLVKKHSKNKAKKPPEHGDR